MFKQLAKSLVVAGALAVSGLATASEPMVLPDETLDAVSAGYSLPSAAFAYAFTNAISGPGVQVVINVGYAATTGVNQDTTTYFNIDTNWNRSIRNLF